MIGKYDMLWQAIIRPPKAAYSLEDLPGKIFKSKGLSIRRTDIELTNKLGYKLQCSHFEPVARICKQLPCVIYLHSNSSSRLEGTNNLSYILSRDITLFTFDFAGCGMSEGQYISLGYYEKDDVDIVFKYLRSSQTVSSIGIWGRCMGAVTALMYADANHQIGCVVLDSAFSSLQKLAYQLAQKYAGNLSFLSGIVFTIINSTIKDKAKFDIKDIDPLNKHVKKAFIPAFFIAAQDDDFVLPQHTKELYKYYSGQKRIEIIQGNHQSMRNQQIKQKISNFFYYNLNVQYLVKKDQNYIKQQQQKNQKMSEQNQVKLQSNQLKQSFEIYDNINNDSFNEQQNQLQAAIKLSMNDIENKLKNKQQQQQ